MESLNLVKEIVKVLDEKKAENVKIIKISELTVIADYFIIASGTSSTHVRSLSEEVEETISKIGAEPRNIEGRATGWILLDYSDVVVHIFTPEDREYYSLERLWSDAAIMDISEVLTD
ncbi:MAG: ribosome silencing factor [Clostridiales bacterium]|nr:ribosome silencing factor [Clostridiales bacterium]MCD7827744.1 ribosome silencing factor [Clostridiales bacterium]